MFGKIINGMLIKAPRKITVDRVVHYHPSDELYGQFGYLEIIETSYPKINKDELKYYTSQYMEKDGKIIKEWIETKPQEPVPTIEDKIIALDNRVSANEQSITNTELALTEVYEMLEGEVNG